MVLGLVLEVRTLEGRLDEAEIAANFGLQKRCQG